MDKTEHKMKNALKKKSFFATMCACTALMFFTGCPVSVVISPDSDTSILYEFQTTAGSAVCGMFLSDSENKTDAAQDSLLFDTLEIEKSLLHTGFSSASATTQKNKLNQEILTIRAAANKSEFSFLNLTTDSSGAVKKISLTLSPEILQTVVSNQNSIIQKYTDLLMAPCFTNEVLSKEEYTADLSSLYGNNVARELLEGAISIAVKNKNTSQKKTVLTIPLIDILTLAGEKTFTVELL